MTYTLTVRYRIKGSRSLDFGWFSVSVQIEQEILPQVGGTVALLYMDNGQPNTSYFKVEDVIYYPQKKDSSLDEVLGRRKGQGNTDVQVSVIHNTPIEERVIDLIISPDNKFCLGKWSKNEKKKIA